MNNQPSLLFYCQHSLGMGHLVRSLALAAGLARSFRVVFLNGGPLPDGMQPPLGVEIVALGSKRLLSGGALTALTRGVYNRAAADMVARWIAANDRPSTVYHVHGWAQILSPSLFAAIAPVRAGRV